MRGPSRAATGPGAQDPSEPPEPPPTGRVPRRPRPTFDAPPPDDRPWLGAFRLQVTARAPRLAACFRGVERPGTLKWSAEVVPASGRVSEHALEPTLGSDPLTPAQRECLIAVLSDPPYALAADERSTPSRVGVVLEF